MVWPSTLRTARAIVGCARNAGMTTEIVGTDRELALPIHWKALPHLRKQKCEVGRARICATQSLHRTTPSQRLKTERLVSSSSHRDRGSSATDQGRHRSGAETSA